MDRSCGPKPWAAFMDELRTLHLGAAARRGRRSVLKHLTEAYRNALDG